MTAFEKVETYYLFLDESGDHGLANLNPHFPVFVLCGILFQQKDYEGCDNLMNDIKRRYWGNREVIFHSSDIRKCNKEFQILLDKDLKGNFINDINYAVANSRYAIIADGIQKEEYIKKYGKLSNSVYELALSFIIERTVFCLDEIKGNKSLYIIIEERGKKEDAQLKTHFVNLINRGTGYVNPVRFKALDIRIAFRSKKKNINGLQLADLIAYPIARFIIDPKRANPAFDILNQKFYMKNGKNYGLKTYP